MAHDHTFIGLDIGSVRTGIAISRPPVHIPSPLMTVPTGELQATLTKLVTDEHVSHIIVGLPRNMSGESTDQTKFAEGIVAELQKAIETPIAFTDEAATSVKAEAELKARNKPYAREDVDMLAAVYILEDYMREHPEAIHV